LKKASKLTNSWQGYKSGTSVESARKEFEARYGREPAEVKRTGGAVLAGPLTEAELEAKKNATAD
jgi:hypothetical protein